MKLVPLIALLLANGISAQEPGEVYVTPKIDLGLQSVPVEGLEDRTLNLPPGFAVEVFARDVGKARLMAWSPDSVLHVVSMSERNEWSPDPNRTSRILALPDRDRNGRADEVVTVADGLHWPNGMAFFRGDMYVADTHEVLRFSDGDGDGVYEQREVFIPDLATWIPGLGGAEHVTHTIVFDEANEQIYVHQGSSCDLCRETDPERATVLAFNLDGTGRRVFARGLRNSIGLALHPLTGELWATNNGHDREGRDLPPESIRIVREGGFYGWPLAFGYQAWVDFSIGAYSDAIAPFTAQDTLDVQSIERPVATVPAHTAPMAIHFYGGDRFPPAYRNQAFVALRAGQRGNDPGYKVMVIFSDPDGGNARTADFLTGFRLGTGRTGSVWGKPVGLAHDAAGALYVSSDHTTQAVFRVRHTAPPTAVLETHVDAGPRDFALEQNYPNPFNSETVIRYALDRERGVELVVYDVQGQKVATLLSGVRTAGVHSVHWDGRDDRGRTLASGLYFYKLRAGERKQTRKLLLLR